MNDATLYLIFIPFHVQLGTYTHGRTNTREHSAYNLQSVLVCQMYSTYLKILTSMPKILLFKEI